MLNFCFLKFCAESSVPCRDVSVPSQISMCFPCECVCVCVPLWHDKSSSNLPRSIFGSSLITVQFIFTCECLNRLKLPLSNMPLVPWVFTSFGGNGRWHGLLGKLWYIAFCYLIVTAPSQKALAQVTATLKLLLASRNSTAEFDSRRKWLHARYLG